MGTFWSYFLDFFGLAWLAGAGAPRATAAPALGEAVGEGDRFTG